MPWGIGSIYAPPWHCCRWCYRRVMMVEPVCWSNICPLAREVYWDTRQRGGLHGVGKIYNLCRVLAYSNSCLLDYGHNLHLATLFISFVSSLEVWTSLNIRLHVNKLEIGDMSQFCAGTGWHDMSWLGMLAMIWLGDRWYWLVGKHENDLEW